MKTKEQIEKKLKRETTFLKNTLDIYRNLNLVPEKKQYWLQRAQTLSEKVKLLRWVLKK